MASPNIPKDRPTEQPDRPVAPPDDPRPTHPIAEPPERPGGPDRPEKPVVDPRRTS